MEARTALITGASKGIGRLVARGLASQGFRIAAAARSAENLSELETEIKGLGTELPLLFPLDVANENSVESMIASLIDSWGKIDVLFNNAAINRPGSTDISYKEFDEQLAINFRGSFNVLKAAVPYFKKQGFGHIINVASICGVIGFAGAGAYCSTKFALRGLSESLFRELVPLGVKVTSLCPSWVDTEMAAHSHLDAEQMIEKEDLLKAVNFLLSLSPNACLKEMHIECRSDLC